MSDNSWDAAAPLQLLYQLALHPRCLPRKRNYLLDRHNCLATDEVYLAMQFNWLPWYSHSV